MPPSITPASPAARASARPVRETAARYPDRGAVVELVAEVGSGGTRQDDRHPSRAARPRVGPSDPGVPPETRGILDAT
jgi:hypothetical protein